MKLNYDLIRTLLLHIEDVTDGHTCFHSEYFYMEFPDINPNTLEYHLKYLFDAGLIEGKGGFVLDITPFGREYLDTIRDNSIWEKTKAKFQPLGSVTLSVISDIASSFIAKQLGL